VAAKVSSDAHIDLMKDSKADLYEYNYSGYFVYYSTSCSLSHQAYLSIVGSGNRSAILHYNTNQMQVKDGDFILIDAGSEFRGYATDITRTFPVNGKFSPIQKSIYEMVLSVVEYIEANMRAGVSWRECVLRASHMVCQKLLEGGYLQGSLTELIANSMWRFFYPHGLGHSVGLDVHDPGLSDILEANMVVTVEPGIYFNRAFVKMGLDHPELGRFIVRDKVMEMLNQNFGGVRIEDTVIVTNTGIEIISTVPKTVEDIEALMQK